MSSRNEIKENFTLGLLKRLEPLPEIIRFKDEPHLCSLLSCIGLQFEMQSAALDRLSPYVSVVPGSAWSSDIFSEEGEFGISLKTNKKLMPRNRDLAFILNKRSINENGELGQIVILPNQVAKYYGSLGFDLVIVKSWVQSAFLNPEPDRVNYLVANDWELQSNTAQIQTDLMLAGQISLSGTHDIVDHLIGANYSRYREKLYIAEKANEVFSKIPIRNMNNSQNILSYLVGIILDDLAQPRWYGSERHSYLASRILDDIVTIRDGLKSKALSLPPRAHQLIANLRNESGSMNSLQDCYSQFLLHM